MCIVLDARSASSPPPLLAHSTHLRRAAHARSLAPHAPLQQHTATIHFAGHVRHELISCQGAERLSYGVVSYMSYLTLSIASGMVDAGDNLGLLL